MSTPFTIIMAEGDSIPGLCVDPDPSTKDYVMQQTMLRVKDPKISLDFYSRVLGMRYCMASVEMQLCDNSVNL